MSLSVTKRIRNVTVEAKNRNISIAGAVPSQTGHVTYTHSQASASSTWVITHNLGCRPAVTIVDSGGNVQIGEVLYNSDNQVTVTFSAAFSGYAYLN